MFNHYNDKQSHMQYIVTMRVSGPFEVNDKLRTFTTLLCRKSRKINLTLDVNNIALSEVLILEN